MPIRFNKPNQFVTNMVLGASEILYSVITELGREKVRMVISSDINSSVKCCQEILEKCLGRMNEESNDEIIAELCEALLHFMLTAAVLPSERKVKFKGAELDVVIPSVKTLAKDPEKSLVIQVLKNDNDYTKIAQAESVQEHRENIWLVSSKIIHTRYRNYRPFEGEPRYSEIVRDIHLFVESKGIRGLRLLGRD
ncbi:MAG: hypothetical protein MN733_25985 [Nitrososphaera sp.]|nr:hypothetical protein [Nitrososphaera sp.]